MLRPRLSGVFKPRRSRRSAAANSVHKASTAEGYVTLNSLIQGCGSARYTDPGPDPAVFFNADPDPYPDPDPDPGPGLA